MAELALKRAGVIAYRYSKSNASPILKLFLSRLDELVGLHQKH